MVRCCTEYVAKLKFVDFLYKCSQQSRIDNEDILQSFLSAIYSLAGAVEPFWN